MKYLSFVFALLVTSVAYAGGGPLTPAAYYYSYDSAARTWNSADFARESEIFVATVTSKKGQEIVVPLPSGARYMWGSFNNSNAVKHFSAGGKYPHALSFIATQDRTHYYFLEATRDIRLVPFAEDLIDEKIK